MLILFELIYIYIYYMEIVPSGVRKGTWFKEEDDLLRACIQRYGEGKWHLVPQRAGLNRCRKSCRLRWVNYLKPDIKRGNFSEDEDDMIMRFHRLLGNRWSLIAGRFPGRTSNDVKNYWNSHLRKKVMMMEKQVATMKGQQEIMRPRPVSLSRKRKGLSSAAAAADTNDNDKSDDSCRDKPMINAAATDSDDRDSSNGHEVVVGSESEKEWWQSLLLDDDDDVNVNVNKGNEQDSFLAHFWDDHHQLLHFFQ